MQTVIVSLKSAARRKIRMLRRYATAVVFGLWLASCGNDSPPKDLSLAAAEAYVDAFYSFDPEALKGVLASAEQSIPKMLFYQGWAEGGNYEVVKRFPCVQSNDETVACSITVKDDLIGALGIDFNVTDTFHITVVDGEIVNVTNSSNDPQAFYDAREWVRENRPELIELPCTGYFDGGPTPGDCVRAMVSGYTEYARNSVNLENSQAPE
jgi:hypothetical protein